MTSEYGQDMDATDPAEALDHQFVPVTAPLQPFVRHLLHTCSQRPIQYGLFLPPSGAIYLTFNYGARQTIRFGSQPTRTLARLFIGGQLKKHQPWTAVEGKLGLLGAEFTASGFHRLFGVDCSRLTDATTPLAKIVGRSEAESLEAQLLAQASPQHCLIRLQQYLASKTDSALCTDKVDSAVQSIEAAAGRVSVQSVAEECAISERQLNRRFRVVVGITVKHYCKLVQLRQVMVALQTGDQGTLQAVADLAGFYDQAHFIHDFQRLVGTNPLNFLNHRDSFLEQYLARR